MAPKRRPAKKPVAGGPKGAGNKKIAGTVRGRSNVVVIEEPAVTQPKGSKKKVTFSVGKGTDKGKGKAVLNEGEDEVASDEESEVSEAASDEEGETEAEADDVDEDADDAEEEGETEAEQEDDGEVEGEDSGGEEDEASGEEDVEESAEEEAPVVRAGAKKAVKRPSKKSSDAPLNAKALQIVKQALEVGEGSRKRKRGDLAVGKAQYRLDKKKKEVDRHGSPRQLFNLIALLTESQKKDVEDIGFGDLLELKTHAFYHQMIDWLLRKYCPSSYMFLFNRHVQFALTKHDVYDAFMLPCTDTPVDSGHAFELAQLWRKKYKSSPNGELSCDNVKSAMLNLPGGGPEFKKLFVVFAMGTFLAPMVHGRIDFRLVRAVEDAEGIGKLDWCSVVLDHLNKSVGSWRQHNTKSVGGCLLFLQLMYFHRLTWRGKPEPSSLPLVKHWTYDRLKERMAEEVEAYRYHQGFGVGVWVHHAYPVSTHHAKRFYRRTVEGDPASTEPTRRFVTLPLPDGALTDEELKAVYHDVRTRNWMTTQRNLSVVTHMHRAMYPTVECEEDGAASEVQGADNAGAAGDPIPSQGSFSREWNNNSEFRNLWNAMADQVDSLVGVQPPTFSLGLEAEGVPGPSQGTQYHVATRLRVKRSAQAPE